MRRFLVAIVALAALLSSCEQPDQRFTLPLWPDGTEESNGLEGQEKLLAGGRVEAVSEPRMEVFLPGNGNGLFVVICPGGGYQRLATLHEGTMVAEWLQERGIGSAVLYYRMPNGLTDIPLKDAQRAIEIARSNATDWGINPSEVGIMGFSAGGHLAATALTKYSSEATRPDFGVLFYPVISMRSELTHAGSRTNLLGPEPTEEQEALWSADEQVSAQTPPCILFHSTNDRSVPIANSQRFADSLQHKGVAATLHTYPSGGHGWGWASDKFHNHDEVFASLAEWLNARVKNNE